MKRLIIVGLVLALAVSAADARRKRPKAGKVKDRVYCDNQYGFCMTLDEHWKYSIGYAKDHFRLVLTQKNYEIPPDYMDAPEYTKVPRIVVYADTSSMTSSQLLDSLISETYSSDQKKEILKEFEILNRSMVEEGTERDATVTRKKRTLVIDGEPAAEWHGRAEYRKYVQTSATAIGGTRVYGAYGGGVVVAKKGDVVVLFHVISEWAYFENIMKQAISMISTLDWPDDKPEEVKGEEKQ